MSSSTTNIDPFTKNYQPCWTCEHSCGGCEWSKNFEPVFWWKAEPVYKTNNLGEQELYSYTILECPKYEKEGKRHYNMTDDKLRDFVFAVYVQRVEDWITEYKDYKKHEKKADELTLSCDIFEEKRAMERAKINMRSIEEIIPEWCADALKRKAKEGLYDD